MISFARMPSSIATLVVLGKHSTACRNSLIVARCCLRIGFIPCRKGGATLPAFVATDKPPPGDERNIAKVKLGVHVGYWGLGMGPQDQLQVVQEAERLGYDSVWTAEAYGSDAATVLAWLAAQTRS